MTAAVQDVAHAHEWEPIAGACARYGCWCGAAGHRGGDGRILETRGASASDVDPEDQITARPIANYLTGRVPARFPKEWESWEREQEL